jgi:hypothetical protein
MSKRLALLILSLGAVASAQAMSLVPGNHHEHDRDPPAAGPTGGPAAGPTGDPAAAPEIDPASAMSAFTLLAGGLVLIRGRRASK